MHISWFSCTAIRNHLKEKGVTASELCAYLMLMPAFRSDDNKEKPVLLSEASEELERANTVDKIFIILNKKYVSFLDYEVFQALLDEYGTNNRIKKLKYTDHLKEFVNRHQIKKFVHINPLIESFTDASKEVILKIDIESTCNLARLTDLKKSFSNIIGLSAAALRIVDVKEGCVELTLLIPAHLADFIFNSDKIFTANQIQQFNALSVEWLKCNGYMFNFNLIPAEDENNSTTQAYGDPVEDKNNSTTQADGDPPTTSAQKNQSIELDKNEVTIVLAGKSGAGKTTLVNRLFSMKNQEITMSPNSDTANLNTRIILTKEGVAINIIDTVGFQRKKNKNQLRRLSDHTKGEVDLLLYCLPIPPGSRFDDWNPDIMKALQNAFGKDIWQHSMVVLTFSNLAWEKCKYEAYEEMGRHDEKAATAKFKYYVSQYVQRFKQELHILKVKNVGVASVYDENFDANPDGEKEKWTIACIPAGNRPTDKVMPELDYKFKTHVSPDVCRLDSTRSSGESSDDMSDGPNERVKSKPRGGRESVRALKEFAVKTEDWRDVLILEIIRRSKLQSNLALLQFWYSSKRIRKAFRQHGIDLQVTKGTAGGVAGGAVGGAVGGGIGFVLGGVGGPIGMGVGLTLGIMTGIIAGTLAGGGGAVAVAWSMTKIKEEEEEEAKKKISQTAMQQNLMCVS